jgi:23S rRNA (adenine2503-C2)-methyltransferase
MAENTKTDLKNFTQEQLVTFIESMGQPAFRGRQILAWIYRPGITEFHEMTDLAKKFRAILPNHAVISRFENPLTQLSADGTVKFGFSLTDGRMIESVLIPEEDRNTICVSSQVGCAMGCKFCLTGSMGFYRNLTTAEIVNQVCAVQDYMQAIDKGQLTNIVFMGMGEPLANLDNLIDSIAILTEQRGLDFSSRRITVSTCGLVPQMITLGEKTSVNLAISLHAPDDATRSRIMPVNERYPIAELLDGCRRFSHKKRQRIMFEYTMLEGVNDSDAQARQLIRLLRDIPCKFNLLSMNETDGEYRSPPRDRVLAFQKILRDNGLTAFIRKSRGADISAACGQLAGKS